MFIESEKLTQEENKNLKEFFETVDGECRQRFGLPYIHANTLVWVGNRYVRFTMINGYYEIAERFQPTSNDSLFDDFPVMF